MSLIGSKTENDIREQMLAGKKSLLNSSFYARLLGLLREQFKDFRSAVFLNWTPDQDEDIFVLLIDTEFVVTIELPKNDLDARIEVESVFEYRRNLKKKVDRITLDVGLQINDDPTRWIN